MTKYPTVSDSLHVQAFYEFCREQGTSHLLAEMFAHQCPPMSNSDREFLEGRGGCYNQFPGPMKRIGDLYRKQAEAAGVNVTGKVYLGGLAQFPGDPRAWVSDRSDVKRVCEEQGMGCKGAVNVKRNDDLEPTPAVGIADDLVQETVDARLEANPELVHDKDLWHDARESVKPHWAD